MESHKEFFSWASNQGVIWNGIDFQDIPGCGTGVIATRTLKVDAFRCEHRCC